MSLQLVALNLALRLFVKPALRRMRQPAQMRERLERDARWFFRAPDGATYLHDTIARSGAAEDAPPVRVTWASCGRPNRRRVLLYLHGGAYIAGSPGTHRHLGAALSAASDARVILPDYRLAPEHPFPAALDDAAAIYAHLLATGYEPREIALAGDSAGGGLAFALILRLRDAGTPLPGCVVGFSPWTDMTGHSATLRRNARRDAMLPVERLDDAVAFYLGQHDRADPLASPVLGDWTGAPPALILASRTEILLGDAQKLADAMRAAGVDVQLELWRNLPHAWPLFRSWLPEADQTIERAGAYIARHLETGA